MYRQTLPIGAQQTDWRVFCIVTLYFYKRNPVCVFHSLWREGEYQTSGFTLLLSAASSPTGFAQTNNNKTCRISRTSLFLFLYMTTTKKKRRHVLHPCASLTSSVGLVEAAMVAAPEAGVSTLSMAQSHPLYMFTPTVSVVHCVGRVAANLSNFLRGVRREKLTDKQLGACLLNELTKTHSLTFCLSAFVIRCQHSF